LRNERDGALVPHAFVFTHPSRTAAILQKACSVAILTEALLGPSSFDNQTL